MTTPVIRAAGYNIETEDVIVDISGTPTSLRNLSIGGLAGEQAARIAADLAAIATAETYSDGVALTDRVARGAGPTYTGETGVTNTLYPRGEAERYGVTGDGTTLDVTAVQNAIASSQGRRLYFRPGMTILGTDGLRISFAGVREVVAHGVTFKRFHAVLGDDCNWRGGVFDQSTGVSSNSIVRITGSRVKLRDLEVTGGNTFTCCELRDAGTSRPVDVRIADCLFTGPSAITFFACKSVIATGIRATSTTGDDAFVLKDSLGNGCEDITINGCEVLNGSSICAIGSEVLSTGYVRNVVVTACRAHDTAHILNIKPCAIQSVTGYTLGLVEQITVSDCSLIDLTGSAYQVAFLVTPGRGATVRHVKVSNCSVTGRQKSTAALRNGIRIDALTMDAITGANVSDVTFDNITFFDSAGGVDNGVTFNGVAAVGYPTFDAISIGGSAVSTGNVVSDLYFRNVKADGAAGAFCVFDNPPTVSGDLVFTNPVIRNIRKNTGSRYAFNAVSGATIRGAVVDTTVPLNRFQSVANVIEHAGVGTPETFLTASIGSRYLRTDGGAATSLYIKESGTAATGWVGK